jgi:hypothetical protein
MPLSLQLNFRSRRQIKGFGTKPLDIVTTAGSAGNIIGVANLAGNTNRGRRRPIVCSWWQPMKHKPCRWHLQRKPYGATTNNLPTEDDFFLFSGISFSTGVTQQNMVKPCPVFCY